MLAAPHLRGSSRLMRPLGVRLFSAAGAKRSWVEHEASSDFPIENLPFGVFSCSRRGPRCATAIGDKAVDLAVLADAGLLADLPFDAGSTFRQPTLNKFMSMSRPAWRATRARLQELLAADGDDRLRRDSVLVAAALKPLGAVKMHLPAQITDYTDFYASREHATNVGIMFRGRENALQPNWLHLPVGYHGRASSVVVSGTPVARPRGQLQINREDPKEGSQYGPCKLLDYELEMGVFLGGSLPPLGRPVTIEEAEEHIFGYVILNDWSARDVQAWEYVPLGPFTAKNFASTISPWIVTPDALAPFKCPTSAVVQKDPEVLPYLKDPDYSSYNLQLEIDMITPAKDGGTATTTIARSNFSHMYWTARQMLAHHSVTGCPMTPGDLLGSGTISGTIDNSKGESINYGSLLEQTWRGAQEIKLSDGASRKFIQDGDSILMRGFCQGDGFRVGFGPCEGEVLPAGALDAAVAPTSQTATVGSGFSDVALSSYWRSSCSWRVRIALAHYGVAFKYEPVHLVKGEQSASEHLMGQVPSLSFTDGEGKHQTLTQSVAIVDFLDAVFGSAADGPAPLVPPVDGTAEGAMLRARALEIAEVIGSGIQPLQNLSVLKEVKAAVGTTGEEVEAKAWAKGRMEKGLAAVEKLVAAADSRFAAGHVVTVADSFLIPQLYNARRFGVDVSAFPNLLRVEAVCAELPAFRAAQPDAQPDFDPNAGA